MVMDRWSCIFGLCKDFLSIIIVYVPCVAVSIYVEPPRRGFFCNDESLKHPYSDSTIPSNVLIFAAMLLPSLMVLFTEAIRLRKDKEDGIHSSPNHCSVGRAFIHPYIVNCYQLIIAYFFGMAVEQLISTVGKNSVGRLRPHFLAICRPDFDTFNCLDEHGEYRYVEDYVCTTNSTYHLKEMRKSFPSGHSSMACYSMTFIILYLQCRMTWKGSRLLKLILQGTIGVLGLLTCMSRVMDHKHHCTDVLCGSVLGVVIAIVVVHRLSFNTEHSKSSTLESKLPI